MRFSMAFLRKRHEAGRTGFTLAFCLVLTFSFASLGWGSSAHYVSTTGGNQEPFDSWENAALNPNDAIAAASQGDIVEIAGGTYLLTEAVRMKPGVIVRNKPGDVSVLDGTNIVDLRYVVEFKENFIANGATLSGVVIQNGNAGILIQGEMGNSTIIQNCEIRDNTGAGIRFDTLGSNNSAPILDGNSIHNNGEAGIRIAGASVSETAVVVRNNTIYNNAAKAGVAILDNSRVVIGPNNSLYGNLAGVVFEEETMPNNMPVSIIGNSIYSNTYAGIAIKVAITGALTIGGTGESDHNDIYSNSRGGIGIQNSCTVSIVGNAIHHNIRGGIHTGKDLADGGGFFSDPGTAALTIEKNKVYSNGSGVYGGGIDVRHARGTIRNNLVFKNHFGGIRWGWESGYNHVTDISYNTISGNGSAITDMGGGIIYDSLAGPVNEQPSGEPPGPILIRNNIIVDSQSAGIRSCFDNSARDLDYNMLWHNNGTTDVPSTCCYVRHYGGCTLFPGVHDFVANPAFVDKAVDDYRLLASSPAQLTDENGTQIGAYGGFDPLIDW